MPGFSHNRSFEDDLEKKAADAEARGYPDDAKSLKERAAALRAANAKNADRRASDINRERKLEG